MSPRISYKCTNNYSATAKCAPSALSFDNARPSHQLAGDKLIESNDEMAYASASSAKYLAGWPRYSACHVCIAAFAGRRHSNEKCFVKEDVPALISVDMLFMKAIIWRNLLLAQA